MSRFLRNNSLRMLAILLVAIPVSMSGCGDGKKIEFISLGAAPIGGAFNAVGNDLASVLNDNKGDNNWKVQAKATKGSQENIRRLVKGELQIALSNSAISYFAVRGEGDWDQKYEIRAVMTLAPNVAMFITREDSGIKNIADLRGKNVLVGPAGAGFDMFVRPILEEHGVKFSDFGKKMNNTQSGAVELLADGKADAAFLGGAVPTAAITQACSNQDIFFIPFDPDVRERLVKKYPFFSPITIPKSKYKDLKEDYAGLNVGSMHLITSKDADDELIYQLTKTIWENRESISHPAAKKFINEKNAARFTGTEFHPGAIKFYKEIGIWKETPNGAAAKTTAKKTGTGEKTSK